MMDSITVNDLQTDTLDVCIARRYDLELRLPMQNDHDYGDVPNFGSLSEYKKAVITYIAGYVVRMVKKKILCPRCQVALTDELPTDTIGSKFLLLKNRSGLVKASISVILVCEEAERCFNRMHTVTKRNLPLSSSLIPEISTVFLAEVGGKCFISLMAHMFDTTPDNNHVYNLVKCISQCYCKIMMHHLASQKTAEITGIKVRKQFTKLVLFKHQ